MSDEAVVATEAAAPAAEAVVASEPIPVVESDTTNVVAEPVVEAVPEPKTKESSRFAELARKDKAIREKQKAIEAREKELEAVKAKATEYETLRAQAKEKPLEFLVNLGITVDDLTNAMMTQGIPQEVPAEVKEMEAIKKELAELKAEREAAKAEKEAAEQQRKYAEYKAILDKDLEEFPLAKAFHDSDAVIETIKKHYEATGEIKTHKEVLAAYEAYYEAKLDTMKDNAKVKQRFGVTTPPPSKPLEEKKVASKQETSAPVTLSNKAATPAPTKSLDEMSERERIEYAASLFRNARSNK